MAAYDFLDCIDWSSSRAYSASNTEQGVYLNREGREPEGIVSEEEYRRLRDEIVRKLQDLRDPETGEKISSHIYTGDDLYEGPCADQAPDIILFLQDGECLIDVQLKETVFENGGWHTGLGTHRLEGIFIAHGPDVRKGVSVEGAKIVDMAPTLLHLQGLPIPAGMDGRPLVEILDPAFLEVCPISYAEGGSLRVETPGGQVLSREEVAQVEEKLKGLGYL